MPDAAVFSGDLDQVRTVAEQEQPESEPKADAIRGTAAIIRRISQSRQKMEAAEAKKVYEDKMKDHMEPIGEHEHVEWDGLRRRKTIIGGPGASLHRRKTLHPPLGLTHFPDTDDESSRPATGDDEDHTGFRGSFLHSFRRSKGQSRLSPRHDTHITDPRTPDGQRLASPGYEEEISVPPYRGTGLGTHVDTEYEHHQPDGSMELTHVYGPPSGLQQPTLDGAQSRESDSPEVPAHGRPLMWASSVEDHVRPKSSTVLNAPPSARRQFSFQNVFHRNHKPESPSDSGSHPPPHGGLGSRQGSKEQSIPGLKSATEEERLGLVKGDSSTVLPLPSYHSDSDLSDLGADRKATSSSSGDLPLEEKEIEAYEARRGRWSGAPQQLRDGPVPGRRYRGQDEDSDPDLLEYRDPGKAPAAGAFI